MVDIMTVHRGAGGVLPALNPDQSPHSQVFSLRLAFASPAPRESGRPPLRQRATSLVLAVTITLLMILGLLTLNGRVSEPPRFKGTVLMDFKPDAETADTSPRQVPSKTEPMARPKPAILPPPPIPMPVPPQEPATSPYYIHLTKEENDAADIGNIARVARSDASGQQLASSAGDSRPVGTAPDGEPLYEAQWYRRPTNAELDTYLPPHMPPVGWGLVACRTVANHHVEDCIELGSSPPGSHLAGAVRQAAWQFLVRPPRLGGRELIGAWVSIEIDYSIIPAKEAPETEAAEGSGE